MARRFYKVSEADSIETRASKINANFKAIQNDPAMSQQVSSTNEREISAAINAANKAAEAAAEATEAALEAAEEAAAIIDTNREVVGKLVTSVYRIAEKIAEDEEELEYLLAGL